MPNDIDKALLDRLQALRGSSASPDRAAPVTFGVDTIERAKTPSREDALAARLKSLRGQNEASPTRARQSQSPTGDKPSPRPYLPTPKTSSSQPRPQNEARDDDDADAMFQTDDKTLEELLGDVDSGEQFQQPDEPGDDEVKALLEELSRAVPQDDTSTKKPTHEDAREADSDDSDGENMSREADYVMVQYREEAELDARLNKDKPQDDSDDDGDQQSNPPDADLALPSVPSTLQDLPSAPSDLADITARLAALRTSSGLDFPSVPTSKPSKKLNRLTSKTDYTDDDMDSWCTVCLEDATLRCLGCDDDPYCARCWREMHIGPSAGFDERSHKAVQFTKDKKGKEKKVALGA